MNRRDRCRGSAVLYTIVLSPIIMLSLALAVEGGALQLEKERLRSAADVATLSAAASAASQGTAGHIDADAAEVATRTALIDNLTPLASDIAGTTAADIAAEAQVVVVTAVPADDPLQPGQTLEQPTLETRMAVPVRSGLLTVAGLPPMVTMTIESRSVLRIHGPPTQAE